MSRGPARMVAVDGFDVQQVIRDLLEGLRRDGLRLVLVFADWRLDQPALARGLQQALPAPVVGCSTIGVIRGQGSPVSTAAAIGFYGDWVRVGVGVASDLPKSAFARSRDAVHQAAAMLGMTAELLDPARHVALTLVDGGCGHEEAFCIASAAAAPQIRVVGGSAASELATKRRSFVWANGEALSNAGVVVILETSVSFEAVTSHHMTATAAKTVVTLAAGRTLIELDGRPAAERVRELVDQVGGTLDESMPSEYSFARFVEGVPYLRSMTQLEGSRVHFACALENGHVLRLMRSGDLIQQTRQDLAGVAQRLGGELSAFIAFSCIGRHWEAAARGLEQPLADAYAAYPTIGIQSHGERTGMLFVNHTLTGLAIGMPQ